MKTKSKLLAEQFVSGDVRPILEAMYQEYAEHGLQENKVITLNKFASYVIGYWISLFERYNDNSKSFIKSYISQENDNKPIKMLESLTKIEFVKQMGTLPQIDQRLYAELLLSEEQNIDQPLFFAGLINQNYERQRIGKRIKELREEVGMTQDQLADKTGLLKPNISRIESGKYSTGQDILSKIASALGKKLDIV